MKNLLPSTIVTIAAVVGLETHHGVVGYFSRPSVDKATSVAKFLQAGDGRKPVFVRLQASCIYTMYGRQAAV